MHLKCDSFSKIFEAQTYFINIHYVSSRVYLWRMIDVEFVHAKGWSDGKGFCYHLGRPRTLMLGLSGVYKEKGVVDCRWFPILCPPSYWRTETIVLLNPGWPYDPLWLTERGWNDWISEAGTQEFCGFHSPCLACSLLEVRIQVRSVMTSHVLGTRCARD